MAKASDKAKEIITAGLRSTYPNSAIIDKKLYINLNIEGEEVQIAVTLTAPKAKVSFGQDESSPNAAPAALTQDTYEQTKAEVKDIFDFFNI